MTKESETPNPYDDLQIENMERKREPKYNYRPVWLVTVAVILLGVVCFAAGFVTSYFAVLPKGEV